MTGAVACAVAFALAAPTGPAAPANEASTEELGLLAGSLKAEGRGELERQVGAIPSLPIAEVEAELDPAAARVDGRLRLLFQNREAAPLAELVFRLYPAAGRAGTALGVEDVRVDGLRARSRVSGTVLEVALPRPLPPGARTAVALAFHGRLQRLRDGEDDLAVAAMAALGQGGGRARGGPSSYGTFAAGPRSAALVDWYPQLASRAGGRWDRAEPGPFGDAARAEVGSALVTLTVPRGWRVAGAGAALGQHVEGTRERATFALAGLRGGLGLAVLREGAEARGQAAGVAIRATALNGPEAARALVSCAGLALEELSRRFGPYPWSHLALAEVPLTGGAGGVELPGLSLVARALGGGAGSQAPEGMFDFTCHHEVAHQWWQALVGSDPAEAPWVDEALAQFSAALVAEGSAGTRGRAAGDRALARFVSLNYQGMRLLGVPDGPVARPTRAFRSPLAYAGLVYGKAPWLFVRVRDLLGDEKLDEALRTYRRRYAFREAGPRDFLQAARAADPARVRQLEALERRWLHEAHGDEDLPPLDPGELLGLGAGGAGDMLSQLLQGGRGGRRGVAPGLRGPSGLGAADERALRDSLRQLERLMPGLRRMLEEAGAPAPEGSEEEPAREE